MRNNIPKLRFNGFNDEWKTSNLDKLCEINPKNNGLPDKFKYIDLESIVDGMLVKDKDILLDEAPSRAQRVLSEGDVLFQTVRPYQMNNYIFRYEQSIPTVASTGYAQLRSKVDKSNNDFIYQIIHNKKFNNKVMLRCTGTSYPAINSSELAKISLKVPSLEEQEKIANFLTKVDKIIEKEDEKVRNLENYKKGMMQKIFSQEIRFKDENGEEYPEWEEKQLGEISDIGTGNNDLQDKVEGGKYPFYVRSANIERIDKYTFDGEAILIPGDGNIGRIYHYINGKFAYHQRVYKISDFKNNIYGKYVYFYMKKFFLKEALKNSVKATVDSLRLPTLTGMSIKIPCLEEQTKIANFLSNIDVVIDKEKEKLEELRLWKKGLLQQMFV